MSELGGHQPALDVDLPHPVAAAPGVRTLLLQETQGLRDGLVVRRLDSLAGLVSAQGPEQGDGLGRGEHQVITGHGLLLRGGLSCDEPAQLLLVTGVAPVRLPEQLPPDSAADGLPLLPGRGRPSGALVPGDLLIQPAGQLRVGLGVLVELLTKSDVGLSAACGQNAIGVRANTLPEQGRHLRLGHLPGDSQQRLGVGHPLPRGHPLDGVVVTQLTALSAQLIGGGDLAGVVGIPVPSTELVDGHHRSNLARFHPHLSMMHEV